MDWLGLSVEMDRLKSCISSGGGGCGEFRADDDISFIEGKSGAC